MKINETIEKNRKKLIVIVCCVLVPVILIIGFLTKDFLYVVINIVFGFLGFIYALFLKIIIIKCKEHSKNFGFIVNLIMLFWFVDLVIFPIYSIGAIYFTLMKNDMNMYITVLPVIVFVLNKQFIGVDFKTIYTE